jgi:hypothetical protein
MVLMRGRFKSSFPKMDRGRMDGIMVEGVAVVAVVVDGGSVFVGCWLVW